MVRSFKTNRPKTKNIAGRLDNVERKQEEISGIDCPQVGAGGHQLGDGKEGTPIHGTSVVSGIALRRDSVWAMPVTVGEAP